MTWLYGKGSPKKVLKKSLKEKFKRIFKRKDKKMFKNELALWKRIARKSFKKKVANNRNSTRYHI